MSGSLYLGSQKVCPVIVSGSSEPTTCVFRVPDDVTNISTRMKNSRFMEFPYDIAIDFNNVEDVSAANAFDTYFAVCDNITSLKDKIKTISGRLAFNTCFGVSYIPEESTIFENLESITAQSGLTTAFYMSKGKQTYRFTKLSYVSNNSFEMCFAYSSAVKHIYFNSLTENSFEPATYKFHFTDIVCDVDGCTLHFPSNLSSVIPTLYGYPNFGGTNTVILYDLPATN